MDNGWVKLHRSFLGHPIWKSRYHHQTRVFIACLLMANHTKAKLSVGGKEITLEPGELWTSLESLEAITGLSNRQLRTSIRHLENLRFLTNESTKHGRKISIMNWDTYQRDDREGDRPNDRKVTNDRQTTDRQPTKNNKNKNVKNEKNERRRAHHQKEFRQFMEDYGMNIGWDDAWVEWQANMEEGANPDDIIGSIAHYDAYLAEHEYKRRNPANYLANGWWQSFTKPLVVKDPKAAKEADEWAALDKQMKAEVKDG